MIRAFLSVLLAFWFVLLPVSSVLAQPAQTGEIPDWQKITFGSLPPLQGSGQVDENVADRVRYLLDYNPARAWTEGTPVNEVIKLGDLEQFSITERSLAELTEGTDVDLDKVALSALGTSSEQTIASLTKAIPSLNSVKVGDVPVFRELLLSASKTKEGQQVAKDLAKKWEKLDPRIKRLPLGQIVSGDFKGALDASSETTIKDLIRKNPALSDTPLDNVLEDIKVGDYKAFQDLFKTGDTTGIANIYGRFEQDVAKKLEGIDPLLKGLPIRELIAKDFDGAIDKASEIALKKLAEENPLLKNIPLAEIIKGDFESAAQKAVEKGLDIAISKFLGDNPTAGNIPLGSNADLTKFAINSIPGLKDAPVDSIPGLKDEPISKVPGVSELPLSEVLRFKDLLKISFAKVDLTLGEKEMKAIYPISGSTKGLNFKPETCNEGGKGVKNCAHLELADNISLPGVSVKGRQWIAGESQTVKGGKGILALVNNGNEPTGVEVFGPEPNIKVVINNVDEAKASADMQIYLRFCKTVPIIGKTCTPYFLGPIPFGSVSEKGLILVASSKPPKINIPPDIQAKINEIEGQYFPSTQSCAITETVKNTKHGHIQYEETDVADLIVVGSYRGHRTEYMRKDAGTQYLKMSDAAKAAGINLVPISGFRTIDGQTDLWNKQIARRGSEQEAAKYSAPPGFSEHHTGLSIDIGELESPGLDLSVSFETSRTFAWLQQNAPSYGFEISFKRGNSQGVSYEPWHWRYVGGQAKQVFRGITTKTASSGSSKKNLDLYLERIRVGESDNCRNIGPNRQTGAYGCYQFIKSTRDSILRLYGVDGWGNRQQQDAAAIALIRDVSKQIRTDIIALIQQGNFAEADRLLGQGGHNGPFGTFTSLPGGDEASLKWKNKVLLAKYSPGGVGEASACGGIPCEPGKPCLFANPLPQGHLNYTTNKFGQPRIRRGVPGIHEGVDLQSDKGARNWEFGPGEQILAVDSGKVDEYKLVGGTCGGVISIWHPEKNIETRYLHMVKLLVSRDATVKRGQPIGIEGNEQPGCSSGTHLHYEVRVNKTKLVDPTSLQYDPPMPKTPRYG